MLKLLIVDDEPMELAFLVRSLKWEDFGIEIAGTANDGLAAERMEEELRPDIIITDIVMPAANGIELATVVKERRPNVRFIFVSGHRSFEFAQLGIESGVDRYLLKPVTYSRLVEAVQAVSELCLADKRRQYEQESFYSALSENMPKLRLILFEQLISDVPSEEYATDQLSFHSVDIKPERLCAIVLRIAQPLPQNDVRTRKLVRFEVSDAICEVIKPLPNICMWAHSDSEFVMLLNCTQNTAWIGLLTQSLLHNVRLSCDITLTAGVGEVLDGYTKLPVCYDTACAAADYSFFTGSGQTIFYGDIVKRSSAPLPIPAVLREQIARAASIGNSEQLRASLDELKKLLIDGRVSRSYACNVCIGIISGAVSSSMQLDERVSRSGEPPYDKLFALGSLDEILACTENYLSGLCTYAADKAKDRHNDIAARIKELIAGRLDRDISVESLADELYLSRGYISHVFKNVTGESINRYVTRERIKRAKSLLCDPTMKITDIAAACGYDNPTYFSSLFRNETGSSPKEYRAMVISSPGSPEYQN